MPKLFAQPYDLEATGFYFDTAEEYETKAKKNRNSFGQIVEEYEIQFIDGNGLECALADAWGLYQCNFALYLRACDEWDEHDMLRITLALKEGIIGDGDIDIDRPDMSAQDIDIYEGMTMIELAEQFVDDGLFGDIPDHLANYIDYEAIARDLRHDYSETEIDGRNIIYRSC